MARKVNGSAIRAIREALGISQRSLSVRTGIRPSALSNIEHGSNSATVENIRRIADELGVPIDAISHVVPDPAQVAS